MCGFAGMLRGTGSSGDGLEGITRRMTAALEHRGPDDHGLWSDAAAQLALGHRRLAILDLSPAGHQPMLSGSGRFAIAFNGEIYNHGDLRVELAAAGAAPAWRGHSDTETLLAAIERWGLEATLARTVGMFALALWDAAQRRLYLARDRFGEKPLYYGWAGHDFVFGSELKALRAHPGFRNTVSREALAEYLRFLYVPAPRSIHAGVFKLEPGCLLTVDGKPPEMPPADAPRAPATHGSMRVARWWSLGTAVAEGARLPLLNEDDAVEALDLQLRTAVRLQSIADVPLGAFLSGGIDSSTVVALMQQQSSQPVRTFTVGFAEAGFDESEHASAVARHLGTQHTAFRVSAAETRAVIPALPRMYDEPFADSSQIPTYLVCRAARQHVAVALSGDAADELFGGYNRYFWAPTVWRRIRWLPASARHALGSAITAVPVARWDGLGRVAARVSRPSHGVARLGDKLHKLAARLQHADGMDDLYRSLVSEWLEPERVALQQDAGGPDSWGSLRQPLPAAGLEDAQSRMMYWDSLSYLPDDILCKVDRAAMAVSLETRAPFLDHRVAELAWRLPLSMKVRGRQGKWILRQVLDRYVPRALIERPKSGFAIPIGQWLRTSLREWADALLDERRLRDEGYFRAEPIRTAWAEHLAGRRDWTARLWGVLMFQAWLEELDEAK